MPRKQLLSTASRPALADIEMALDITSLPPAQVVVHLPENAGTVRNLDFGKHYGHGCDLLVYAAQHVIERMTKACIVSDGKTLSPSSIADYFRKGLSVFLPFCATVANSLGRELRLEDLDRHLIDQFIAHLQQSGMGLVSQKNRYTCAKSVLVAMGQSGWIAKNIFPRNPFPHANLSQIGESALSESERASVLRALKADMRTIIQGSGSLTHDELVVCLLAIAARTGINPTPALELLTDCLQPHPVKADRYVLVYFKRRGNNTHIRSLRRTADIESMVSALPDVARIIDLVRERNASTRQTSNYPKNLFVFGPRHNCTPKERGRLTVNALNRGIDNFLDKHRLSDADGRPLKLNVMRLRKTFENRLFTLSGQDPFLTAKLVGHTLKVSNDHYLEAPESAEKDWRLMGEVRTKELLNYDMVPPLPAQNTPVASCRDTLNGEFAPKNGEHCQKFLACFRCRSFVVTGDDLYRIYSLYWMLVRIRKTIGAGAWKRVYGHIIRIIDNEIALKFGAEMVTIQRHRAKIDPHPFWKNVEQLEGAA